jgi:hypothetical protein
MPQAPSANCCSIHCSIKQDGRRIIDATWSAVANVDAHYVDPFNTCTVLIQTGNVPLKASQEVLTAAKCDGSCWNDTTPSTLKVVMQETPRKVTLLTLPSLWVPFIPWRICSRNRRTDTVTYLGSTPAPILYGTIARLSCSGEELQGRDLTIVCWGVFFSLSVRVWKLRNILHTILVVPRNLQT